MSPTRSVDKTQPKLLTTRTLLIFAVAGVIGAGMATLSAVSGDGWAKAVMIGLGCFGGVVATLHQVVD